ncbi:MAG: alpha/beta hydrolase [Actinobacteria bacterium]|nr:alpha/beta hydrolase [Actinomycetota bacterium]
MLLLHGWPGSVWEFRDLIPRLTDPGRFGGDPADAFTVVAPSLPGFTLSFTPGQPRPGIVEMAELFAPLMVAVLDYRQFAAQGGDRGGYVVGRLRTRPCGQGGRRPPELPAGSVGPAVPRSSPTKFAPTRTRPSLADRKDWLQPGPGDAPAPLVG